MSLADGARAKGDSLVEQAKKKMNGFSFFSSGKYETGCELLTQAGAQYKIARAWKEAGDVYVEAGELNLNKLGNRSDAIQNLCEAGRAYKNVDGDKAIKCLTQAAKFMMEDNRFSPAAKLWTEIGEIEVQNNLNNKAAIIAYTQAADCYRASNSKITSQSMQIKVAELLALEGNYLKAIEVYEEVADAQADSSSVSFSVSGYYYKALLCMLAYESDKGVDVLIDSEEKWERYVSNHPRFDGSKEAILVKDLIEAYNANDGDKFTQVLAKYDSIFRLDEWSAKVLYNVKKNLNGEGKASSKGKASEEIDLS